MRVAGTPFTAESAKRPKTFCGHIQRAQQLAFQAGHQQIVVVAKFPADASGLDNLKRFCTAFRADRLQQALLQRYNGVPHYRFIAV